MIDPYLWLKWVHILSATVLFGTGIGTAFQMYATHRRGEVAAIAVVARNTILADWLFITPAGVVQVLSGAALIQIAGFDPLAPWLTLTYTLYAVAAVCWIKVVQLQYRIRDHAVTALYRKQPLSPGYHQDMALWFWLGWPAFFALLTILALMVVRPEI